MPFDRAFAVCVRKIRRNIQRLADDPKSAAFAPDGNYFAFREGFFDIGNWTSSFFTGMALLAYRQTKDPFFLQQVRRLAPWYQRKIAEHRMDTMHDLGFLYSLYSVALFKLTGEEVDRATALAAAGVLAERFQPNGGYIRAWGRLDEQSTDYAGLAIIDCLMNLPLLFWAAETSGEGRYRDSAVRHADTTLQYFLRADGSVYHAYRFDVATGRPVGGDNYCGRAVESHWARGTAWAIYGLALAYRYTKDVKYRAASRRLADRFLQLLDDELVPVWDFRLPPGEARIRDASAAAIAACGLQELARHDPTQHDAARMSERILTRLCSNAYLDACDTTPGILRCAEVGDDGLGTARSVYASWGDYFFMEALSTHLHQGEPFW